MSGVICIAVMFSVALCMLQMSASCCHGAHELQPFQMQMTQSAPYPHAFKNRDKMKWNETSCSFFFLMWISDFTVKYQACLYVCIFIILDDCSLCSQMPCSYFFYQNLSMIVNMFLSLVITLFERVSPDNQRVKWKFKTREMDIMPQWLNTASKGTKWWKKSKLCLLWTNLGLKLSSHIWNKTMGK